MRITIGLGICAGVALAGPAFAADPYPVKPIRIVVPFAAGGSTDLLARHIAQRLTESFKSSVIVENRPGAGGIVGAENVAKSPPDGYAMLMGTVTTHAVTPHLFAKVPFDAQRDFAPITEVGNQPQFLDIHPSIPVRSVKELIALARARPGQITFGTGGQGSASHMAGELLKSMGRINLNHVPYKGTGPAMSELLGGHLSMMFDVVMTSIPHIRTGKIRAVGVSSLKRVELAPEVPTIAEQGLAGFEALVWFGLFAPANTPPQIVNRLQTEIAAILRQPKMKEVYASQGLESGGSTPAEFAARVREDNAKWGKLIKEAGIKLD